MILRFDPSNGITNYFDEYKAKTWNSGDQAYLNRAWCRLEMIYAASIPLHKGGVSLEKNFVNNNKDNVKFSKMSGKHNNFSGVMMFHISAGICIQYIIHIH